MDWSDVVPDNWTIEQKRAWLLAEQRRITQQVISRGDIAEFGPEVVPTLPGNDTARMRQTNG